MLKDLVKRNRSYRSFDASYRVSREELEELVDTARFTASSRNVQALKFYLSFTKKENEEILALTRWAGLLKEKLPPEGHEPTAYIVICQDTDVLHSSLSVDVGIAAQTILLSAVEKGLGGCMIGAFNKAELTKLLNFKESIVPQLVIALGKPDDNVILTDVKEDGNTNYYRNKDGIHYVPKRSLQDLLIND